MQLLRILDDWITQIDQGYQVDVIYTDFEKAFDKVPHQRLLNKLKSYGITDVLLKSIENFLFSRKQCARVNGKFSKGFLVKSGIPQGNILGPIIFLIYINDLPESCDISRYDANIYLYADDTKVYTTIKNSEDNKTLQAVVNKIKDWSDKWLLKLNIGKCKVMSYSVRELNIFLYRTTTANTTLKT